METSFDSVVLMQVSGQIAAEAKMLHRKSYLITEPCIVRFVVRFIC